MTIHPKQFTLQPLLVILLLILVGIFSSLPQLPTLIGQGRDSGIFAYTAKVVLDGGVPYRDAWDNKPPVVYFVNALAFALFGVNRWALWSIEVIFTILTAWVFYRLIWELYRHKGLAILGTVTFTLLARYPGMVLDGNFTETYALLPQVICLAVGVQFLKQPSYRWGSVFGLSACLAFLTKQTTIGVAVAFPLALLISRHPILKSLDAWKRLVSIVIAGLLGLGLLAIYLQAFNSLDAALDAMIYSPSAFHQWVGKDDVPLWETILTTIDTSTFRQVFLPLMPFFAACISLAAYRNLWDRSQLERTWLVWIVLMFGIDIVLTNVTNRAYSHYYITVVPSLVLICVAVLYAMRGLAQSQRRYTALWLAGCVVLTLMGLSSVNAMMEHIADSDGEIFGEVKEDPLVDYIEANTRPEDLVLVWGASSKINFQSRRDSPTQYHYAYPLLLPDHTEVAEIAELIQDLRIHQPAMIVDRAMVDGNRVPPLDSSYRKKWYAEGGRRDTTDLRAVFDFVDDNCYIDDVFNEAVIYRCAYPQYATDGFTIMP